MTIDIVWGVGDRETSLGAFDAALQEAGIHNANIVTLSSVIPPEEEIAVTGTFDEPPPVGSILWTVMARANAPAAGQTVAAGLGWAQSPSGGIFVEATAESAPACRAELNNSLAELTAMREWEWADDHHTIVKEVTAADTATVVVAAVYGHAPQPQRRQSGADR